MQHHRWVTDEPRIPFDMTVLYEDEAIIVVDKPHFLATMPRGMWYRETALIRLREMYDEPNIVPAHRLDRMTAGVVVFVRDPALRGAYQTLFQERRTTKIYECLAPAAPIHRPRYGTIKVLEPPRIFPLLRRSRIVKDRGILQAYEEPGQVNAETVIELGESGLTSDTGNLSARMLSVQAECVACSCSGLCSRICGVHGACGVRRCRENTIVRAYTLRPRTGKTHQLRVHMNSLGLPIVGDDFYPHVVERPFDDFSQPLELVARYLSFVDPVSRELRVFVSHVPLGGVVERAVCQ